MVRPRLRRPDLTRRVLVCERRLAEFDRRRGDLRLHHHMGALLDAGWHVSFLAFRRDTDPRYARILRQMGVEVTVGREHIESVLIDLQPDVVLPYMWSAGEQMLPWVRGRSPQSKVVVDTGDLHLLRRARAAFRLPNLADPTFGAEAARELNTYAAADVVLAVSDRERALVDELTGRPGLASLVPLSESTASSTIPVPERRGIVFVGNFLHDPNREALDHLMTGILPRLEPGLLAHHPVLVLGYGLTDELRDLAAGHANVRMVGWVPDLTPYLHRARAVVVPLLTGAGVKGKLLQALAAGAPVVSTSVGAEGTAAVGGRHLLVADDPGAFAAALTRLLVDEGLADRLAGSGPTLLSPYRPEVVQRRLVEVLEAVVEDDRRDPLASPVDMAAVAQPARLPDGGAEEPAGLTGKIFCLGLTKTGTTSLHHALQALGFRSLHWGPDDEANGGTRMYLEVLRAKEEGRRLLDHIGDGYDAYSDIETLSKSFQLADLQYPGSRFILTVRDVDDWIDSRRRHVERNQRQKAEGTYLGVGSSLTIDADAWRAEWDHHVTGVLAYFAGRPDDLLVMDVSAGDGYELLAPFLGRETPSTPFPHENAGAAQVAVTGTSFRAPRPTRRALLAQVRHPTPDRDGGSSRTLDMAEALQGMGFLVTFCALAPEAGWERYARLLQQAGVEVRNGMAAVTDDLSTGAFEVAAMTFWPTAELLAPVVAELSPHTAIVLHSGDLHALRTVRRAAVAGAPIDDEGGRDFAREMSAYLLADRVVMVSEDEADVARRLVGDDGRFAVVPLSEAAVPAALPLSERRGLVFVGNFRHVPNLEAAVHLCDLVLPHVDVRLLEQHPLTVIGNGLDQAWYAEVKAAVLGFPRVRLPGWVPDLQPYVSRARLSVAPLLHGAGVKGKVLTSLAAGTPVVTTPVGAEGLGSSTTAALTIAESPFALAQAIERLLTDDDHWEATAALGPPAVGREHGRASVLSRLQQVVAETIAAVPERRQARGSLTSFAAGAHRRRARLRQEVADRLGEAVTTATQADGDVLVLSDGSDDDGVLKVPGRTTRPFPAVPDGAALRPVSGAAAVSHLRAQIDRGARYLVVPAPSLSWLHRYPELARFLDDEGTCLARSELGRIYRLPPVVPDRGLIVAAVPQPVADRLAAVPPATCTVEARLWRHGEAAPLDDVGDATLVVAVDQGAQLPPGFWDRLAAAAAAVPFDVLQPAFTPGSGGPPAYEAQGGVLARAMPTVPGAPVLAARPSAVRWLTDGLGDADGAPATAVLDAVPVGVEASALEGLQPADPTLTTTAVSSRSHGLQVLPRRTARPEISVVIATYQRADLLAGCLESFADQDVAAGGFEVVVVDDGSGHGESARALAVVESFRDRLAVTGIAIDHAGRSAAKNVGILAAQGDLVLLFDDDDVATPSLIRAHLAKHADHPEPELAVLGRTTWAPQLAVSPVMHFVTDIGMLLFSYPRISSDQVLDYRHFWEGRVSCKRAFLLANGLHDQRLAYTIDIELGRRLDAAGLKVVYAPEALSHMARAVTFTDFARRCEAKGRAARQLSQLHPSAEVRTYCAIDEAERAYPEMAPTVPGDLERLATLEEQAGPLRSTAPPEVLVELDQVYRRLFRAATFKGIVEAGGRHPGLPVLSVVIPIWSVTEDLAAVAARTVDRIWEVARVATEVIVVDNGSPFPRDLPATTLVRWPENRGVAVAWNAGLVRARGEVLAVLNSDVLVEPGWDEAMVEAASTGRRIAFPFTDHCDGLGPRRPDKAGTAGWCFALSRDLFHEIGLFDEQFAPAYWEDTDYWHRAHVAGIALSPVPAARVQHARRTTARYLEGFDGIFERNRRRYERKHGLTLDEAPPYWHRSIEDHAAPLDDQPA